MHPDTLRERRWDDIACPSNVKWLVVLSRVTRYLDIKSKLWRRIMRLSSLTMMGLNYGPVITQLQRLI